MNPFFLICTLLLIGLSDAGRAEVVFSKGNGIVTWPFLRGQLDFTVRHPLRVFHGKIEKFSGSASLNPENLLAGIEINVEGNSNNATVEGNYGKKLLDGFGPATPWRFNSHSFIHRGTTADSQINLDLIMNFVYGGRVTIDKMPVICAIDAQAFRCRFEGGFRTSRIGFENPKIFFLPISDDFDAKGEFVFGDKEGGK